jgi:PAS domain S-box-containing protein
MILQDFKEFLFGTFRGRLILGVALVHAVMMSLFIIDLTVRQRTILLDRQVENAKALAQSLSTSSAVWIESYDISGLQELVDSQRSYPELLFAILTDKLGHILAHTDIRKQGLYLQDLPNQIHDTILLKTPAMVDVLVPVKLSGIHIGWVRIGISGNAVVKKLAEITYMGILYAIVAIAIGSLIAWWIGYLFTRRLYAVQNTISEVRTGNSAARSTITGTDEAASIASEFNILLDTLGTQYSLLSALINSPGDIVIFSLDRAYCYTTFNEMHRKEMKKVWNADIMLGMSQLDCIQIPHLKDLAKQSMDRVLNGEAFSEIQHQPDTDIYYEFSWNPIFQNNKIIGITAFIRNVTERKHAETQILKLNRLYAVLSNINQTIVRIHDTQEVLHEACRIVIDDGKFRMAWIGLVNLKTNKVDVVASNGVSGDYLEKIDINLNDEYRSNGPTGIAIKTGKFKTSNNIKNDDNMIPWRKDALMYNYKSSASFPLIVFDKIVGAFTIYSDETDFFHEEDIRLLDEMARDISFALEFIESETEHKNAEKKLKVSEEQYRTLVWKIQVAVLVHGADTKIITCNAKAQELLGLTEDQLLGKTAIDPAWHFYREDKTIMPIEEYPVNHVMATQQVLRNYIIGVHRPNNESDVWCLVNADPVFDSTNQIIQVIVTFINITNRKKIEEALYQSEERFRRLAENARDVIYRMSLPDGKYEYVSPATYALFGYYPEDFYANPSFFLQIIHPNWHNYFEEQWTNLLKGEMPPTYEYQIIHKSGEVRWLNQRNILIHDEKKNPIAIEGIVTDITKRKQAEEEIQKLNQELEKRVEERTAQLANANKELEAFSYSVSHDLRTPLRSIDGFSQVLLEEYKDKLDVQGKNYLYRISASTLHMAQLIDDMLNLSRVSRSEMNIQTINLSEVAQEIADDLHESQPERQVEFIIQKGISARGDNRLLRIVMENLIGNAWKFTSNHPTGRIEFGLDLQKGEPIFFIRDDGAGFDMNYQQKLFGVFQRLHTTTEFPGTGVGLATVQRIILRHGGKVWAKGEVEKGAIFYFTIP